LTVQPNGRDGAAFDPPAPTRVVIAEDEAIIRMDLGELLREEGYDVVAECANGEAALDAVAELRPDVAVLDVKMPVLDGLSAARILIEERACAVVLLTAFSQRELIAEARDAGVMAYVVKPFERADLVPAIEMATGRFAEMVALADRVEDLSTQLQDRKVSERAKGRLIDEHGLGEEAAYAWLRRAAMDRRTTMRAIADAVLAGELTPDEGETGRNP
jgi:response regulator NasT